MLKFGEDDELILAMKEINQRREELKISYKEWFSIWLLAHVRKRKRIDNFEYQSLRDVVKEGREDVIKRLEKKFKDMKVEGNKKSVTGVMYTDPKLSETHETKYTEFKLEALYMETESEARKRFQRQVSYRRRESFDQRSTPRPRSGSFV